MPKLETRTRQLADTPADTNMVQPAKGLKTMTWEEALRAFLQIVASRAGSREAIEYLQTLTDRVEDFSGETRTLAEAQIDSLRQLFDFTFRPAWRTAPADPMLAPPSGLARFPDGRLAVADDFNHRIQIYDPDGTLRHSFGAQGKAQGEFMYPRGLAVDAEGCLYVADSWNHRVQKFDPEGDFMLAFGCYGTGAGELNEPYAVTIEPSGRLIVLERSNHRLQFFAPDGTTLGRFGTRGTVLEEQLADIHETSPAVFPRPVFEFPSGLARDSQGNHYVADSGNHRVLKFDRRWEPVLSLGGAGTEPGRFQHPTAVAAGQNDLLYVADLNNDRVQIFTPEGYHMATLGQTADGQALKMPVTLLAEPAGHLWVGCTFDPALYPIEFPALCLEETYRHLQRVYPEDGHLAFCVGQYYERSGHSGAGREAFLRAAGAPDAQSFPEWCRPLALHLAQGASSGIDSELESALLTFVDPWRELTCELREELKACQERILELASALARKEQAQRREILEDREDALEFDRDLYDLRRRDKDLFRESRALFHRYRTVVQNEVHFLTQVLNFPLSDDALQACLDSLALHYHQTGQHIGALLTVKDRNEEALVTALQGVEGNPDKLAEFHVLSTVNNKIVEMVRILLTEFVAAAGGLQHAVRCFPGHPRVTETLDSLVIHGEKALLFPRILLGMQEDWELHEHLDREFKALVDAWALGREHSAPTETRKISLDEFQPVAFDTEHMRPEDLLAQTLYEVLPPNLSDQGVACGNIRWLPESEYTATEWSACLRTVFDNQESYESKFRELFPQLKSIVSQKPELERQALQVDVRDRKTPIHLNNNLMILGFQTRLVHRMIHTLEINALNNLCRLALGLTLFRQAGGDTREYASLLERARSWQNELREHAGELTRQWKPLWYRKAELEKQVLANTHSTDPATLQQTTSIQRELEEAGVDYLESQVQSQRHFSMIHILGVVCGPSEKITDPRLVSQGSIPPALDGGAFDRGCQFLPTGLAHTAEGDLLVANLTRHRIMRFSQNGTLRGQWGGYGNHPGGFNSPYGLCVDHAGDVYVADADNLRVQKFTIDGEFILQCGGDGPLKARTGKVFSCSVDSENNLWVADCENDRIQVYSPEGRWLKTLGTTGESPGDLHQPISIACLAGGDYLVGDRSGLGLKRFDPKGDLVATLQVEKQRFEEFYFLACHPEHGIFAADSWTFQIFQLDSGLKPVRVLHNPGKRAGQFCRLGGLSVYGDRLVAGDFDNSRLLVMNVSAAPAMPS